MIENLEQLRRAIDVEVKHRYIDIRGKSQCFSSFICCEAKKYYKEDIVYPSHHYLNDSFPPLVLRPREAYHASLKHVKLDKALNKISKEMIMTYPPGIPVIIPGERFTQNVIDELKYFKKIKANILSDFEGVNEVSVVDETKLKE